MIYNYLWGTSFKDEDVYDILKNKPNDINFDFLFKRLFENEFHAEIYQNLGEDNIIRLKDKFELLNKESKSKWELLVSIYDKSFFEMEL